MLELLNGMVFGDNGFVYFYYICMDCDRIHQLEHIACLLR